MSDPMMPVDQMDYAGMTQTALRGVIRQAIMRAASPQGLPGEHHFYISYLTRFPGVSIPKDLLARYPREITIVLQHMYQSLRVDEEGFSVTLTFGGIPKPLVVPFDAITRFHDPHVQFTLAFETDEDDFIAADDEPEDDGQTVVTLTPPEPVEKETAKAATSKAKAKAKPAEDGEAPKIVSLDQFRKK